MFQDRWHAYELVSVWEAWNGEIRRARKLQVIFFLKIRALVALRASKWVGRNMEGVMDVMKWEMKIRRMSDWIEWNVRCREW